jgi:hypothetical protein
MHDIRLVVDGDTYTDERAADGSTGVVTFDFDRNEFTIDSGDRVTVEVQVDFRALSSSLEGTTIYGHVNASAIEAEGKDDLSGSQLQSAATGETHTLYTKGSSVSDNTATAEVTSVSGANNDYATFKISVSLTAFGQDVYIPIGNSGVTYQLQDSLGNVLPTLGTAVVTSSARERNGYFHIEEGSEETLTLTTTYQPDVPNTTARLQLISINFNDTASAPDQTWQAVPSSKYRTPTSIIVN